MALLTQQGMAMPKLGFGTYRLNGRDGEEAVGRALAIGYRHIDTAEMYGNEAAIGAAIAGSGVARSDLHLTSKVWLDHLAPADLRRALEASLERLRVDALDLYLIHWPAPQMDLAATLATMMAARDEGLVRAIGVSNFTVALMREAIERVGAPIACNQVEYHVLLGQGPVLDYARAHGVAVTAYAPLGQGRLEHEPVLAQIGRKHGASASQIGLKWLLDQPGVAAVPKAARAATQAANWAAQAIELDDADRAAIADLPKTTRLIDPPFAPRWD